MRVRDELNKCSLVPSVLAIGLFVLYSMVIYLSYIHPGIEIDNIRLEVKDFMLFVMGFYFMEKHYGRKRQLNGDENEKS